MIINIMTGERIKSELLESKAAEIITAQKVKNMKSVRRLFNCFDAVPEGNGTIIFIGMSGTITTEAELHKVLTDLETIKPEFEPDFETK